MKRPILTKIIFLSTIFSMFVLQSCGRKGPLKLPDNEPSNWQKEDKNMYE